MGVSAAAYWLTMNISGMMFCKLLKMKLRIIKLLSMQNVFLYMAVVA